MPPRAASCMHAVTRRICGIRMQGAEKEGHLEANGFYRIRRPVLSRFSIFLPFFSSFSSLRIAGGKKTFCIRVQFL